MEHLPLSLLAGISRSRSYLAMWSNLQSRHLYRLQCQLLPLIILWYNTLSWTIPLKRCCLLDENEIVFISYWQWHDLSKNRLLELNLIRFNMIDLKEEAYFGCTFWDWLHNNTNTKQITRSNNMMGIESNTKTAHNWQKWKSRFLTCPCHKIYREEAVGLKSYNYTLKITIFVNMWNLGQFRENLIFCQ